MDNFKKLDVARIEIEMEGTRTGKVKFNPDTGIFNTDKFVFNTESDTLGKEITLSEFLKKYHLEIAFEKNSENEIASLIRITNWHTKLIARSFLGYFEDGNLAGGGIMGKGFSEKESLIDLVKDFNSKENCRIGNLARIFILSKNINLSISKECIDSLTK